MKKLLLSGFEPFAEDKINPTSELIQQIDKLKVSNLEVHGVVLPVTFAQAFQVLQAEITRVRPDYVLAMGLASGRDKLCLERVAINCKDSSVPDNSGVVVRDQKIDKRGKEAYFSTLPLRAMFEACEKEKIPVAISNTAGTYVCNYLLYRLLQTQEMSTLRCGFLHVPYIPENNKQPNMSLEDMQIGIFAMLGVLGSL